MSIFDREQAVDELKTDRLIQVLPRFLDGTLPSESALWRKIRAAEKKMERELRVFLEPVEVLPESATQADKDALDGTTPPTRWVQEPAYDYDPEYFRDNRWGLQETRHRPIIRVDEFVFAYPTTDQRIFNVPAAWIHFDPKYGIIRLVPTGVPFEAPFNAYILSAIGGGRIIPHTIQIRYAAGLQNVADEHPDIYDLTMRFAVLSLIDDAYTPQSQSVAVDGLSQSFSVDTAKYRENFHKDLKRIRDSVHGIRAFAV